MTEQLKANPLYVFATEVIHGAYRPEELKNAAMRAIRHHSAARAKMGVAVPMTREQVKSMMNDNGYTNASPQECADFINGIRHAERHHGIVGKEGA